MKRIVIAIDGFSGTGKSSTAKQVAAKLGYTYIDSGAMYRAVTHYLLEHAVDVTDLAKVKENIRDCSIEFEGTEVTLNGKKLGEEIRSMKVSESVSQVSAISAVREKLVKEQRKMGNDKGVVMDGRDIGTIVFPNAELKVFMTADLEIRAKRRQLELEKKGIREPLETVKRNLASRDASDSSRKDSPLVKASDAKELDTSDKTLEQQIDQIVQYAKDIINEG